MLIEKSGLKRNILSGKTVLLTGAGGGIGFEAARNLVWMGATVIIAEINREKGAAASKKINEELECDRAVFYEIDISDEKQLEELVSHIILNYGFLDVIFNNATITPLGPVDEVSILDWDKSYAVNLRAPVFLAQKFLPMMKERNRGTIVFVPSSGAAPYMGAYEVFKTSQVELCNTIAAEVEKTNICVYSIGPGLVKTQTACEQINKIAKYMGISIDEFYAMNESQMLDVESAGAGFAVSVAMADTYKGQEIGSIQALIDAGIIKHEKNQNQSGSFSTADGETILRQLSIVLAVFEEQYEGWLKRSIFERQWVLRDLKKVMKRSAEQVKEKLESLHKLAAVGSLGQVRYEKGLFQALAEYYEHQLKLLKGYEKDPAKLEENSKIIIGWMDDVKQMIELL